MNARQPTGSENTLALVRTPNQLEPIQCLTFVVCREMFALPILTVREIIEFHGITTVPMMPATIRGVINLRGAVVPVMDLAVRFGRPQAEITKRSCIIIVELEGGDERMTVGVVVDAVSQVLEIAASDVEPPPAFGAMIRTDFIRGMCKVDGKFVILLDVNHVLSVEQLGALGELSALPLAKEA